jgi:hypothetical protein
MAMALRNMMRICGFAAPLFRTSLPDADFAVAIAAPFESCVLL